MLRTSLLLAVACFLLACSHAPVRDLRPEVSFAEVDLGRGRAVFLTVNDARQEVEQHDLQRQGIVAADFSLPLLLKREVRAALYNFGFTTAHHNEEAAIGLQVDVLDMAYIATDDQLLTSVFLRNEVRLVLEKPTVRHTFTYATQRNEKLPIAPSVQKSREHIAAIIAETLQRAFKDPAFLAELSAD